MRAALALVLALLAGPALAEPVVVASGAYPEVTIADWNGYSFPHPNWFTADGVHVTGAGTEEAAKYLSRTLAFLDRRPCPAGMGGPVTAGGWCASPDLVGAPG